MQVAYCTDETMLKQKSQTEGLDHTVRDGDWEDSASLARGQRAFDLGTYWMSFFESLSEWLSSLRPSSANKEPEVNPNATKPKGFLKRTD